MGPNTPQPVMMPAVTYVQGPNGQLIPVTVIQGQPQQPQGSIWEKLGNKAGSVLADTAGGAIKDSIFGAADPAATPGVQSVTTPSAAAMDVPGLNELANSLAGAYDATPVVGANALAEAQPVVSDASWLGSSIGSGLESMGVGAETAGMLGSGLGYAIPAAAGLYGGYQLYENLTDNTTDPLGGGLSGAATGAAIGSFFPGIGTLAGALLGGAGGTLLGSFGGNKDKGQRNRDAVRARLHDMGVLGDDYTL